MSDQPRTLSQSIKGFRKAHRLSQDEVAEAVGVHRQAVSNWERGVHEPTARNLEDLAKLFGTTTQLLRSGHTPTLAPRGSTRRPMLVREASPGPWTRLSPRIYERVFEYCSLLERAGVPVDGVEAARQFLTGEQYDRLNAPASHELTDDERLEEVEAGWAVIKRRLRARGFHL